MLVRPRIAARTMASEGPFDEGGKVFADVVVVPKRQIPTSPLYLMLIVKFVWEQTLMVPRDHHVSPVSPGDHHALHPERVKVMPVHDRRTRRWQAIPGKRYP